MQRVFNLSCLLAVLLALIGCSTQKVHHGSTQLMQALSDPTATPLPTQLAQSARIDQITAQAQPDPDSMVIPPLSEQRITEVSQEIAVDVQALFVKGSWQMLTFTRFPDAYLDQTAFRYVLIGSGSYPNGQAGAVAYFIPVSGSIQRSEIFTDQFTQAPFNTVSVQVGSIRLLLGAVNRNVTYSADSVYIRRPTAENEAQNDAVRSAILHNGTFLFVFEESEWTAWQTFTDVVFMYSESTDVVYATSYADGLEIPSWQWKHIQE